MKKLIYLLALILPFALLGQKMDDITTVQKGGTEIQSIQAGNTVIWQKSGIDTSNLVAYWDLEQNGTDEQGSHNATITNAAYSASGKIGYALDPDGSSSAAYGRVSDTDDFSFGSSDPMSISAWVRWDAVNDDTWLLCKRDGNTSLIEWEFLWDDSGDLKAVYYDGTSSNRIQKEYNWTPTTSTWYHIVVTYDGGGSHTGITLYVDKVSVGTSSLVGSFTAMDNTTAQLTIASLGTAPASGVYNHNGQIDLIQVWSEELTLDKITDIYDTEDGGNLITE